ncbi:MAG: hypothetical protein JWQ32_2079 [Marmoricola sp.]|nr:hypothetical protein [Marmoricola sp.]
MKIRGYVLADVRKALAGGVVPAAALLKLDLADGVLSQAEIGGLVAAFLSGAVLVFYVPNRRVTPAQPDASSSPAGTTRLASTSSDGSTGLSDRDTTRRVDPRDVSPRAGFDASPVATPDASVSAEPDASRSPGEHDTSGHAAAQSDASRSDPGHY